MKTHTIGSPQSNPIASYLPDAAFLPETVSFVTGGLFRTQNKKDLNLRLSFRRSFLSTFSKVVFLTNRLDSKLVQVESLDLVERKLFEATLCSTLDHGVEHPLSLQHLSTHDQRQSLFLQSVLPLLSRNLVWPHHALHAQDFAT